MATLSGGVAGSESSFMVGSVWQQNYITASGRAGLQINDASLTEKKPLYYLPQGSQELSSDMVHVLYPKGLKGMNGNFDRNPFVSENKPVTTKPFDAVQVYYTIADQIHYLQKLGFDMKKILADRLPVVAKPDSVDALNAWFDPRAKDLTFGNGKGSKFDVWHLASDHDIVRHELGHFILDAIFHGLIAAYSGDGGAIHEGYGDANDILRVNDPQVSEDFPFYIGRSYGPNKGLRIYDNAKPFKYSERSSEVHDRGQVYAGFWWAVRVALKDVLGLDARSAADLALGFLTNHGAHYTTSRPSPVDFIDAAIAGAYAYLKGSDRFKGVNPDKVKAEMVKAATIRELLKPGQNPVSPHRNTDLSGYYHMLGNTVDPFAFVISKKTTGTVGGGMMHMQQYLSLNGGYKHLVRMLGSGLIVFLGEDENPVAYSAKDVRTDVQLNPDITVKRGKALKLAKKEVKAQLDKSEQNLDNSSKAHNGMVDWHQIRRYADNLAYQTAKKVNDPESLELIVPPDGHGTSGADKHDLWWRADFGFTTVYVNARTGKTVVDKMPMW